MEHMYPDIPDSLAVQTYPILTENRLRWQSGEKRCLYSLFEQWREEAHLTGLFSVFIMSEDVMGWGSWGWTSLII